MEDRPAPALHICMLGPWRLEVKGEHVPNAAWTSKKALSVLQYLVAHRGRKIHKDTLLNVFWPDDDPVDATPSLHTTIYFLRRMIQRGREENEGGASFVRYTNGQYLFEAGDSSWIDIDEFLANEASGSAYEQTDPERALKHYRQALALYKGDFLVENVFDDWTEPIRTRLRETFIGLSLRAARLLARKHEGVSEAVEICRVALEKDPFREELHQAIMAHLIAAGRYGEAATQYRELTALLQEEFDLPPSPETRALFEKMQGADSHTANMLVAVADDVGEGPYVCEPETFDAIQTVALRVQQRHGFPIGLISLAADERHHSPKQMANIVELLRGLLRQSDVVSQEVGKVRILLLHAGPIGRNIVMRRVAQALTRAGLHAVRIETRVFERENVSTKDLVHK